MDFPQLVRRTLSLAGDPFAIQLGLFEAEIDRTADFPERLYAELEKYGAKRLVLQAQRVAMTLSWDVVHFPGPFQDAFTGIPCCPIQLYPIVARPC